jgi:hypothetical protein
MGSSHPKQPSVQQGNRKHDEVVIIKPRGKKLPIPIDGEPKSARATAQQLLNLYQTGKVSIQTRLVSYSYKDELWVYIPKVEELEDGDVRVKLEIKDHDVMLILPNKPGNRLYINYIT